MKNIILFSTFMLSAVVLYSQKSVISLNAGYLISSDRINDQVGTGNGWRAIGTFQKSLQNEKWSIGISTGFMKERYSTSFATPEIPEFDIQSIPIFVSGKYYIGEKQWKGYLKGSAGLNVIINYEAGWLSGIGMGLEYPFNQKLFLNTEYEAILWQNSFYGMRLIHSANIGIGYKF